MDTVGTVVRRSSACMSVSWAGSLRALVADADLR